jgi:hypothetical protein
MQGLYTTVDELSLDRRWDYRRIFLKIGPGVVIAAALGLGVGTIGQHLRSTVPSNIAAIEPIAASAPPPATSVLAIKRATDPYGALVDPGFEYRTKSVQAAADASQQAKLEIAPSQSVDSQEIPLPPRRDADLSGDEGMPLPPPRPLEFRSLPTPIGPDRTVQSQSAKGPQAPVAGDNRNFFEKLFGGGAMTTTPTTPATVAPIAPPVVTAAKPATSTLSEGPRSGGGKSIFAAFFPSSPPTGYDKFTAVYDISARTVYLPDGTRLEAHSGLGDRLDDVRYVSERMRGPTPPHLYELTPREASFHGVQALRLNPVGGGDLFGRAGLLAHSYMLGPNGDSNGCVSFKDYEAFLRAYQSGQIKRLAVVARL